MDNIYRKNQIIFLFYLSNDNSKDNKSNKSTNNKLFHDKLSKEILLKGINMVAREKTLDAILFNKYVVRIGDGEFEIIFGNKMLFQERNETLKKN